MEQPVCLGGAGTPAVAEFAAAEFGAVLGLSTTSASMLVGDALDLRHRLPRLWVRIQAGEVRAWVGRRTAQATPSLSQQTVALVDRRVSRWAHSVSWARAERLTRTRLRHLEVRAALHRRDRRRRHARQARRGVPARLQHHQTTRGHRLEPAPGGAPGLGRPEDPDLSNQGNPANSLRAGKCASRISPSSLSRRKMVASGTTCPSTASWSEDVGTGVVAHASGSVIHPPAASQLRITLRANSPSARPVVSTGDSLEGPGRFPLCFVVSVASPRISMVACGHSRDRETC